MKLNKSLRTGTSKNVLAEKVINAWNFLHDAVNLLPLTRSGMSTESVDFTDFIKFS